MGDNTRWEFLFVENSQPNLIAGNEEAAGEGEAEEDEEDENAYASVSSVDLPPSWVSNITLTQEQFEKRCPMGRKVTLYQNCITVSLQNIFTKKQTLFFNGISFSRKRLPSITGRTVWYIE